MGLQFMPLEVKGQAGDRGGAGLPDRGAQTMEVGICKCLLAGGPLSRVKGQHALQQPQGTSVRLAEVLLQLHAALLAHVNKEAPRLLIPHLHSSDVVEQRVMPNGFAAACLDCISTCASPHVARQQQHSHDAARPSICFPDEMKAVTDFPGFTRTTLARQCLRCALSAIQGHSLHGPSTASFKW